MGFFRWILRLLSVSIDFFLYVFTALALLFFIVIAYQTNKKLILDSWINSVLFFGLSASAALFIFKLIVEAAASSLKEKMDLYEVILFVKTKREIEEQQRKAGKKIKVKTGLLEQAKETVGRFLERKQESTLPAKTEEKTPELPPPLPQQPAPRPEQRPTEESAKEETPNDTGKLEKAEIKAIGEELSSEAERIRQIFQSQLGEETWEQAKDALDLFLSYFLKSPEASSIGIPITNNSLAEKLSKIPLLTHTRHVVEKAAELLSEKDNLFGGVKTGVLFAALLHDIGKLERVWKEYTDRYESSKHGEYGANLIQKLANAGELPEIYDGLWENVAQAVKNHHDRFKKQPDWIEMIRKADYMARAEELRQLGEPESQLEKFYQEIIGVQPFETEEFDLDEIAKVVSKRAADYIKKMATNPALAYIKTGGGAGTRLLSMVGEADLGDTLKPLLYVDKSALVNEIIMRDRQLREAIQQFADEKGRLDAKIQSELLKFLEENGVPPFTQSEVIFPEEAKSYFKSGWKRNCKPACMILSRYDLKELNPEANKLLQEVQKRVAENRSLYFFGTVEDKNLDTQVYVPTKEFVELNS